MNLMDSLNEMEGRQFELPAKRLFVVVREDKDDLVVESHAFMIEEHGALSFVEYVMLNAGGRSIPVPQKHEAVVSWTRVYEKKELNTTNALYH